MYEIQIALLQTVYKYYPVGAMRFKHYYPGYQEMQQMLADKIADINLKEKYTVYFTLFEKVKSSFPDLVCSDHFHHMFPSFEFEVDTKREIIGNVVKDSKVVVIISLLCDYYTIFVQEEYNVEQDGDFVAGVTVTSLERSSHPSKDKVTATVKALIEELLPSKKYISHAVIQEVTVDGVTSLNDDNENDLISSHNRTLYQLFFSDIQNGKLSILE